MSIAEKSWQTARPTTQERSKFIFNNGLFGDVKFVVRGTNGESESKQVIPAHKLVLAISSPVFEAMFYGELAETTDSIELPDCEYESLLELFRYLYSDEVNLTGGNVMGVLYLAKKYMVPSLADECTKYLQDHLDPSNVFSILPSAQKYEEKDLMDRCWKLIDKQTSEALNSDGFATIERSLLEAVVKRDTLSIKEANLFKAVNQWATMECERQCLTGDGGVKRRILGETIVKGIRFPVMKQDEFVSVVLDSKILSPEEVIIFFKYYNSALESPLEFPKAPRSGSRDDTIHSCQRFKSVNLESWVYGGSIDYLYFVVDKDIMLHGLCLYGSEKGNYSVTLKIKEGYLTLVSKTRSLTSKLLQYKSGNYYGFEFWFDSAVKLHKNAMYLMEALIAGPSSCHGRSDDSTVVCSGVTFKCTNDKHSGNGTTSTAGQFPEILFSILT